MKDIRFLLKTHYTGSRALIVGIDRYKAASPLSYAVSDAQEVREVLVSEFDFSSENIIYLADEQATRANILKAFLRFANDDVGLDERIIIFYAGHGHTVTGSRGEVGYLVPYDADPSDLSTLIRWDELTRNAQLIRAKHMLFIMDACYSGLALTRQAQSGSSRFLKDMMLRISRQVLTAGKANEVVADAGGPLPNHSVFTGHLIQGLQGNAAIQDGIITASGLMAYVYGKVAHDGNSNQTPHYGHFEGDGDFILRAPMLNGLEEEEQKDLDRMIVIPFPDEVQNRQDSISTKVQQVKGLLASESSHIELHDFLVKELRRLLEITTVDDFNIGVSFSTEEFLRRLAKYEEASFDFSIILACVAHWARPSHLTTMQKFIARSTDRIKVQNGLVIWSELCWYPMLLELYCAGIAAIDGQRYDSLAAIFSTIIPKTGYRSKYETFVEGVSSNVGELIKTSKQIPGHEKNYVPLSEYLYKILQPKLDDALFLGGSYEQSFDRFEVLFALVVADLRVANGQSLWGPIGRFGWKHSAQDNSPLERVISEGRKLKDEWSPIKAGLFGGSFERFDNVATQYLERIGRLAWF